MLIEFAGMPRGGKTTCVEIITNYYLRKGRDVKLLLEGARTCPFSHKYRVETAYWTANKILNDIIQVSVLPRSEMLFFQDRGLFDAMSFIKLLDLENIIQKSQDNPKAMINSDALNNFLLHLSNWAPLVDLVILFEIEPEVAIARDLATKINSGPGIITNLNTMGLLGDAYKAIIHQYGSKFGRIVQINTSVIDPVELAIQVRNIINAT